MPEHMSKCLNNELTIANGMLSLLLVQHNGLHTAWHKLRALDVSRHRHPDTVHVRPWCAQAKWHKMNHQVEGCQHETNLPNQHVSQDQGDNG